MTNLQKTQTDGSRKNWAGFTRSLKTAVQENSYKLVKKLGQVSSKKGKGMSNLSECIGRTSSTRI
ncbi:hypothetical protein CUMW_075830 [Citrus unshiu]|nr:hypothetical protein CUMW_075830 [Citrus unshiu]